MQNLTCTLLMPDINPEMQLRVRMQNESTEDHIFIECTHQAG